MNTSKIDSSEHPILDLTCKGIHWINASAGTGKTYTLTSILVWLMLEEYLPKQIIVTTFTRKAATELKNRIRSRLNETLAYLEHCRGFDQKEQLAQIERETDPLFKKILLNFDQRHAKRHIARACERLKLVIDLSDELYIATLDSLTQKLLREFSFESGQMQHVTMTEQSKEYITQILHDQLRLWIQQQPQALIDYLYLNQIIQPVEEYIELVEEALHFNSAQWQTLTQPVIHLISQDSIFEQFKHIDLSIIKTLPVYKQLYKRSQDRLETLLNFQSSVLIEIKTWKHEVTKFVQTLEFKKSASDDECTELLEHLSFKTLREIVEQLEQYTQNKTAFQDFLKYYLIQQVRQYLPQRLQEQQETTFSVQTSQLATALLGEQGERFAQAIHRRYPVILVDEFQDTNLEQDQILAKIWRASSRYKQGCMVLVGDNKQAIYGFRGGDMLTYTNAYLHVTQLYQTEMQEGITPQHIFFYSLVENHRSIAPLVNAVNTLFLRQPAFGEHVNYQSIQASQRIHDDLIDQGHVNPAPLRWIELEKKVSDVQQVNWHIQHLLYQSAQGKLYFQHTQDDGTLQQNAVTVNDIAVLANTNTQLYELSTQLNLAGIPYYLPSNKSVFCCIIAREVAHVLTAILYPDHEDKVKRALFTRLFAIRLSRVIELEQHNQLSHYIHQFAKLREQWLQYGFLSMWQNMLKQYHVWENLAKTAYNERERFIINLRHLNKILEHQSLHYGAYRLLEWYQKQLNQPRTRAWELEHRLSHETGVQLMTIHKSKGLEFKIVFLLAQKNTQDHQELTYSIAQQDVPQRVVSVGQNTTSQQREQHLERQESENHRLWYVALTRASHRVYACVMPPSKDARLGLEFWRDQPNRQPCTNSTTLTLLEEPDFDIRDLNLNQTHQEHPILVAQPLPKINFKAVTKTSFSQLSQLKWKRYQNIDQLHTTRFEDDIRDILNELDIFPLEDKEHHISSDSSMALLDIQVQFPRGASVGVLLHELFERLDFQQPTTWLADIQRQFRFSRLLQTTELWSLYLHARSSDLLETSQHSIPIEYDKEFYHYIAERVLLWIQRVMLTPLANITLQQLTSTMVIREFKFYLALKEQVIDLDKIYTLFYQHDGIRLQLNEDETARYLVGAIDVVFFDGKRFHIIDYKSNFLGTQCEDYHPTALRADMDKHQYWLQASLYLLALHRYLKRHLQEYCIADHLGSAHYLYLRGMTGNAGQGVFSWKPKDQFIEQLDVILGSPQGD